MKRHINFGSTDQLRHVAHDVNFLTKWTGEFNDQKEPILDESRVLPTIEVEGTEKIHGINAGVSYNKTLGFWVQSRRTIVDNPTHNI